MASGPPNPTELFGVWTTHTCTFIYCKWFVVAPFLYNNAILPDDLGFHFVRFVVLPGVPRSIPLSASLNWTWHHCCVMADDKIRAGGVVYAASVLRGR